MRGLLASFDFALEIGRAGTFSIQTKENDADVACIACMLRSCTEFTFTLAVFDGDMLLHEAGPLVWSGDLAVSIMLPERAGEVGRGDWVDFARRMIASQTARLGEIVTELATLAPKGVFADWSASRRLDVLGLLEHARGGRLLREQMQRIVRRHGDCLRASGRHPRCIGRRHAIHRRSLGASVPSVSGNAPFLVNGSNGYARFTIRTA